MPGLPRDEIGEQWLIAAQRIGLDHVFLQRSVWQRCASFSRFGTITLDSWQAFGLSATIHDSASFGPIHGVEPQEGCCRDKYSSRTVEPFSAVFRLVCGEGRERSKSLETKVAEVHGNRTHRAHLPVNPTGFEVQAAHQARFTSAADILPESAIHTASGTDSVSSIRSRSSTISPSSDA